MPLELLIFIITAILLPLATWFFWRRYRTRSHLPTLDPIEKIQTNLVQKEHRFSKALSLWLPLLKSRSKNAADWEEILIRSDMGLSLSDNLVQGLAQSAEEPAEYFKNRLKDILLYAESKVLPWTLHRPWVLFVVGVNGVGKTTSLVKIAQYLKVKESLRVGVVGADTFRKAAIEQLQRGVENVGVDFFTLQGAETSEGADPAAVVFDGLNKFATYDAILVDTSGRLQNKKNLMEELKKMKRVAEKAMPGSPHDIWLVVDSTMGQNAIAQGKTFHEAVNLTGLVLTKLDGLSRGGTVFQLFQELKTPIRFLGVGEKVSDLEVFNSVKFVEELFDPAVLNS